MEGITFLHPHFFWLLLLLPLAITWRYLNRANQTAVKVPTIAGFGKKTTIVARLKPLLFVLRLLALRFGWQTRAVRGSAGNSKRS